MKVRSRPKFTTLEYIVPRFPGVADECVWVGDSASATGTSNAEVSVAMVKNGVSFKRDFFRCIPITSIVKKWMNLKTVTQQQYKGYLGPVT